VLEFATDPSILGGVVLKVGDKILDASLKAQLQNIRETIKRGE
jgi:F-type H+-transporting ATPase subunit delta